MLKLRIIYIMSLIILGVLLVTVFLSSVTRGEQEYSLVQREHLLKAESEWIIQFDIVNHEGKDIKYTINILAAGRPYNEQFLIQDGGTYHYIHHVQRDMIGSGEATFVIYKEGSTPPFEEVTYYLN